MKACGLKRSSRSYGWTRLLLVGAFVIGVASQVFAQDDTVAFKIGKQKVTVGELYQENQGSFYELEKQKYELIDQLARERYLDEFWTELAKSQKTTMPKAREAYLKKAADVSESEIKETLERFKDHPKLKQLSDKERRDQIIEYLSSVKSRDAIDKIVEDALATKKLVIIYPQPQEPVFKVTLNESDHVRYGPNPSDIQPTGCSGSSCPITVVEYSEFQCPFCQRVVATTNRLLEDYKGKVQWIVRDFPLGFHNRARPAAIAAKCAADQGKYWHMYETLFENQRSLEDKDLKGYAKKIGLNSKKFDDCYNHPTSQLSLIEKNYQSGERLGVTGTPTFFINGRRYSSAIPYEVFKQVFDEEMAKAKANRKG